MPAIALAVVPHSPILVEAIGRGHRPQLRRTLASIDRLVPELYALQPDVFVILTPHGTAVAGVLTAAVADVFVGHLGKFGDVATRLQTAGHPAFAHAMKRTFRRHHLPFKLTTPPELDYGVVVPLTFFDPHLPRPILPLTPSGLSHSSISAVGEALLRTAQVSRLRIVLIASIDLGHQGVGKNGSAAQAFDAAVVNAVRGGHGKELQTLDKRMSTAARTCSGDVLALFGALLEPFGSRPAIFSYEAPVGVGQIVAFYPLL